MQVRVLMVLLIQEAEAEAALVMEAAVELALSEQILVVQKLFFQN